MIPSDRVSPGLARRYRLVRSASEAIAEPLSAEDCVVQSMADASPVKWHLAHVSWFFETFVLVPRVPGYRAFDPAFRVLFNSYYNAVGDKHPRPQRGLLTRPSLQQVRAYRQHVDAAMEPVLSGAEPDPEARALIELGLNHEQQHQELMLTDFKHLLSCNPVADAYRTDLRPPGNEYSPLAWVDCAGGMVEIGTAPGGGFAFDNESPRHRHWLEPFRIADRLVTNAEYLAFVDDGGYARPELWLSDGWDRVCAEGWRAPLYWRREAGQAQPAWSELTLGGRRPLSLHAAVTHVSYYEADAYARWAGARLPTEAEWESVATALPIEGNFVELDVLHPQAAEIGSELRSGRPRQMFGDAWEWTGSTYLPYPGYRPASGAVGEYNGKFMCNQFVLRGGSCVSPRDHLRPGYRNFFQPEKRWQFTGIRLARDA